MNTTLTNESNPKLVSADESPRQGDLIAPPSTAATWRLSPSDFAFLWDQCRRCFHLKVKHRIQPPKSLMPMIFGKIASMQEGYFSGKRTEDLLPGVRPGVFDYGENFLTSMPIEIPGRASRLVISGKVDSVMCFDDGTYGVIDFKTMEPKDHSLHKYGRQLHAYTYALENPATGSPKLAPVTELGLVCFDVAEFAQGKERKDLYYLRCVPSWKPIVRDDTGFLQFLGEVMGVLEQPMPPPASDWCKVCAHREAVRRLAIRMKGRKESDSPVPPAAS